MSFTESMTFAMIMAGIFFGAMIVDRFIEWIKPMVGLAVVHCDHCHCTDRTVPGPILDQAED